MVGQSVPDKTLPDDPRGSLLALRWPLAGAALLLIEYMTVSYFYDALPLLKRGGWLGGLGHAGTLAPLAAVMVTATFVAGGRDFVRTLVRLLAAAEHRRDKLLWLVVNGLAFALLMSATGRLLASPASQADGGGQLALWSAAVVTTAGSALLLAIPPTSIGRILRELRRPLLVGLAAGLLAWGAGLGSALLWDALSLATLRLVAGAIAPFTDALVYVPSESIVGTETFFIIVAPECSGYEGIGLITVFISLYLWAARRDLRFPEAFALLPLAMATVWLGNVVRIIALIAVGIHVSAGVALGGFHSKAGWLFFCAIALSLVALARRWRFVSAPASDNAGVVAPDTDATTAAAEHPQEAHENPTAVYLVPLLVLIATKLATGLFTEAFDVFYPASVATVAATLWWQRARLPDLGWPPSWHAPLIGVAMFPLWLWTFPAVAPGAGEELRAGIASLPGALAGAWLAFRVVGSCVTVPIVEELAFRGFLLRRLIAADFTAVSLQRWTPLAVIGSSLAFGALHSAYIGGTLAGLAYALAQRARGRLSDAIIAHAVTNGLIALDVWLRGHWHLWS